MNNPNKIKLKPVLEIVQHDGLCRNEFEVGFARFEKLRREIAKTLSAFEGSTVHLNCQRSVFAIGFWMILAFVRRWEFADVRSPRLPAVQGTVFFCLMDLRSFLFIFSPSFPSCFVARLVGFLNGFGAGLSPKLSARGAGNPVDGLMYWCLFGFL